MSVNYGVNTYIASLSLPKIILMVFFIFDFPSTFTKPIKIYPVERIHVSFFNDNKSLNNNSALLYIIT